MCDERIQFINFLKEMIEKYAYEPEGEEVADGTQNMGMSVEGGGER